MSSQTPVNSKYKTRIRFAFFGIMILGLVITLTVYLRGNEISKTTARLIEYDVPKYDLVRRIQTQLIEEERILYEYYTTEEIDLIQADLMHSMQAGMEVMNLLVDHFGEIEPLLHIQEKMQQIEKISKQFINNLETNGSSAKWNIAREHLAQITQLRNETEESIQQLNMIMEQTVNESNTTILTNLQRVHTFVILYSLLTLMIAYGVARAITAYLSSSAQSYRLSLIAKRNPNPIFSLSTDNKVTYSNPATQSLLKRLNKTENDIAVLLGDELIERQNTILHCSKNEVTSQRYEVEVQDINLLCELHWLEDQNQWDVHLRDITSQKDAEKKLNYQAFHNQESGLENQYALQHVIKQFVAEQIPLSFTMIEIRGYNKLVSTRGVESANIIVKEVAIALNSIIKLLDEDGCDVFHIGEKDFVVLSRAVISRNDVITMVSEIERKIESTYFHNQHQVQLHFGCVFYPEFGTDYETLAKNARTALSFSSQNSVEQCLFYHPELGKRLADEQQMIVDMRHALENQEFELYFQPQLSLHSNNVFGVEVLIRWFKDGNFIPPNEFIPLAEHSGFIVTLGQWILKRACEYGCELIENGYSDLVVAVNISPRQFSHSEFFNHVKTILEQTKLPPQNLELEITEGVIIYNEEETIHLLKRLKTLGVRLSIDDFGTGYSSLSYLKKFAIDKLKIDQSFIRQIQSDDADRSIVRTVIDLGRNLGLSLIAEGVEEQSQLSLLKSMGCDEIQGYFYSRPIPYQALTEFLSEERKEHAS